MAETNLNVKFKTGDLSSLPEETDAGTVYFAKDNNTGKGIIYLDDENGNRYEMSKATDCHINTYTDLSQMNIPNNNFFIALDEEVPSSAQFANSAFVYNIGYINEMVNYGSFLYTQNINKTLYPNLFISIINKLTKDLSINLDNHTDLNLKIERLSNSLHGPLRVTIILESVAQTDIGIIYTSIVNRNGEIYYASPFIEETVPEGFVKKSGDTMTGDLHLQQQNKIIIDYGQVGYQKQIYSNGHQLIMELGAGQGYGGIDAQYYLDLDGVSSGSYPILTGAKPISDTLYHKNKGHGTVAFGVGSKDEEAISIVLHEAEGAYGFGFRQYGRNGNRENFALPYTTTPASNTNYTIFTTKNYVPVQIKQVWKNANPSAGVGSIAGNGVTLSGELSINNIRQIPMFCIVEYIYSHSYLNSKYTQICFADQTTAIEASLELSNNKGKRYITINEDYSKITWGNGMGWSMGSNAGSGTLDAPAMAIPTAIYFVYGGATKLS